MSSATVARIERLPEAVVNRIAAGEILHRPSNAVKEMLENSIDAKATSVQVVAKDGGMKLLQLTDNGHGIQKDDFAIVCERFTTSKLRKFEDLNSIATYGFRGEALASISHVAHVTITSKTAASDCAWRATYKDGKMLGDPKPCAGTNGTTIAVEDLFYNVTTRRKALSNTSDEYARILDVVGRYAVHNAGVAFVCKKHGSTVADLTSSVTATRLDTIRTIHGQQVARELLPVEHKSDKWQFSASGLISNANYSVKKFTFLLFINHRSVDSPNLKKAIEAVYATYLPKNTHPFVYLSLEIVPSHVDVNVHPTKQEVHFLNEDQIIEEVTIAFQQKLLNANSSRTFLTQAVLPGASAVATPAPRKSGRSSRGGGGDDNDDNDDAPTAENAARPSDRPNHMVRTDNRTRSIDAFIARTPRTTSAASDDGVASAAAADDSDPATKRRRTTSDSQLDVREPTRVPVKLTSILQLREEVAQNAHEGLLALCRDHFFVGIVNDHLALLQHQTKLYLANYRSLSQELFYQLALREFSNFGIISLTSAVTISSLLLLALDTDEGGWTPDDGPKDDIAKTIADILVSRAAMLKEYFSISVSADGKMETMPLVLKGYLPNLDNLPMFLLRLGAEVDWTEEKACLGGICRQLAWLYAMTPSVALPEDAQADIDARRTEYRWQVEHTIFPAMRYFFVPSKALATSGDFVQVADLPDLYKIFERC